MKSPSRVWDGSPNISPKNFIQRKAEKGFGDEIPKQGLGRQSQHIPEKT